MTSLYTWIELHPLKAILFTALFTTLFTAAGLMEQWEKVLGLLYIALTMVWWRVFVVDNRKISVGQSCRSAQTKISGVLIAALFLLTPSPNAAVGGPGELGDGQGLPDAQRSPDRKRAGEKAGKWEGEDAYAPGSGWPSGCLPTGLELESGPDGDWKCFALPLSHFPTFPPAVPEAEPLPVVVVGGVVVVGLAGIGYLGYRAWRGCQRIARARTNAAPDELNIFLPAAAAPDQYAAVFSYGIAETCVEVAERNAAPAPIITSCAIIQVSLEPDSPPGTIRIERDNATHTLTETFLEFRTEMDALGAPVPSEPEPAANYARNLQPCPPEDVPVHWDPETRTITQGHGGTLITIDRSTDLRHWEPLLRVDTDQPFEFRDVSSTDRAFYRVGRLTEGNEAREGRAALLRRAPVLSIKEGAVLTNVMIRTSFPSLPSVKFGFGTVGDAWSGDAWEAVSGQLKHLSPSRLLSPAPSVRWAFISNASFE